MTSNNVTPHWQKIQSNYKDVHVVLQWVISEMYNSGQETIHISPETEVDLSAALNLDFLVGKDNKLDFSNSDVRDDYLVRYFANLLFSVWDNFEVFCKNFDQIYDQHFQIGYSYHEICPRILLLLAQEHDKDITKRVSEIGIQENTALRKNNFLWKMLSPLCEIIPNLSFEVTSFAENLEKIIQVSAHDIGYKSSIYSAIKKLASRSQEDAEILYHEFVSRLDSPVLDLTSNVLLGLAQFSMQKAYDYALNLANSNILTYRQIGIFSLSLFRYNDDDEKQKFLNVTLEHFHRFREMFDPEIDDILARAYGNIIEQSEQAEKPLVDLSSRCNLSVKNEIASILFLKGRENVTKSWYKESLFNLIKPPLPLPQYFTKLDFSIQYYTKTEPKKVIEIIEIIALQWNYTQTEYKTEIPEIFNGTFRELYSNNIDILKQGLTKWFASKNPNLHCLAWQIQKHFSKIILYVRNSEDREVEIQKKIENSWKLTLSKEVLDTLDEQTILHILYRIVGYVADTFSLIPLLISSLARESHTTQINNLVTDLLADYVLYNFPKDSEKCLEYRLGNENISKSERQIIETALERSNSYFKERDSLSRLKEFQPSSQRIYLFQLAEWKHQSLLKKEAEKSTVFLSLLHQIPLKYGRAFSVEQDGQITQPTKLSTFYQEQEISQGKWIDPVGQTDLCLQWRNIGLQDSENDFNNTIDGDENQ